MTITNVSIETIYDYHLRASHIFKNMRNSLSDECLDAVNIHIIIACACYIEGYLETVCRDLLAEYESGRYQLNIEYPDEETRIRLIRFYQRLEDDFDKRLQKATGIEHFQPLIEILTGDKLSNDAEIACDLEAVNVLFSLRHMFAHGRVFQKEVLIRAPKMPSENERVTIKPGYASVVDFLYKQKLITTQRTDLQIRDLASNSVADYFLELAESFCSKIPSFKEKALYVPSFKEWMEDSPSDIKEAYNKEHGTDFTGLDLVRQGVVSFKAEPVFEEGGSVSHTK